MSHPLDNPVWNALNTGNANLSEGTAFAKYFPADITFFAGVPEINTENLIALSNTIPFAGVFGIVSPAEIDFPEPWVMRRRIVVPQLVFDAPLKGVNYTAPIVDLTTENIPAMLALTKLTNPGPFLDRTIEMGHYRGIFEDGQLIAMAGQRMHPAPFAEISAVCTHPDHLGKGYATQLLMNQVERIVEAGGTAFLHVLKENTRAIGVYEALGFKIRKEMLIYVIEKK